MSKNNSWPCKDIFLLFYIILRVPKFNFLRDWKPKYHLMFVHQTQNDLVNLQLATVQANWKDGRTATSWASFGAWFEHQRILQCFELARITRYNTTFSISNSKHDSSSFQNVTAKSALFGIVNSCPLIPRCSYHSCRLHFFWYIYIHMHILYFNYTLQNLLKKKTRDLFLQLSKERHSSGWIQEGQGCKMSYVWFACTAIIR